MCPVVFLALILSLLLLLLELTAAFTVNFIPSRVQLKEGQVEEVEVNLYDKVSIRKIDKNYNYELRIQDPSIAYINDGYRIKLSTGPISPGGYVNHTEKIYIKAEFLGFTYVTVDKISNKSGSGKFSSKSVIGNGEQSAEEHSSSKLPIIVELRKGNLIKAFTISVAIMVSLNYINMGCALDLEVVKSVLKNPIAPAVGFISQFLFMPLIAFAYGFLFFDQSFLKLGLFTFGCSPGGGASNIWTLLFGANLNLSITMTFISTMCALFMLPIWLFSFGRKIFEGTSTSVPFGNIFGSLASMTIFLGIGLLFQRYLPRVSKFCKKILTPVSILMVIFIITFGAYANWFMFKLMTWKIVFAAALNVWTGFLVGLGMAMAFKLPTKDLVAISIETGIQNTGISIVILRFSLPEPDRDIASVVPVAASVMTPIPLLLILIFKKIRQCHQRRKKDGIEDEKKSANDSKSSLLNSNSKMSFVGSILGGEMGDIPPKEPLANGTNSVV